MDQLIEYRDFLESRYLGLRSRRAVVCGLEGTQRKLALYHNDKIKNRMERIKAAIEQLDAYIALLGDEK